MFLFLSFLCFCFWLCNLVPALLCLCFCQTLSGVWVAGDLGNVGGTFGYKNTLMYSKETLTIALAPEQNTSWKMRRSKSLDKTRPRSLSMFGSLASLMATLLSYKASWYLWTSLALSDVCCQCAQHKLQCRGLKFLHLLLGDCAKLLKCRRWGRWW